MWDKDEYFKSLSFVKIAFLILFFLGAMVMIGQVRGEENFKLDSSKYGWPSQVVYDTIGACYQGTYKWIVMANPSLIGSIPPPQTQRAMVEHCFCVLDRVRIQHSFTEFSKLVYDINVAGKLFMDKALKCVKENKTLNGIIILNETDNATVTDNETIIDNSTLQKEEPKIDSEESSPDQPRIRESLGDSETIFQG
ncbi:MAG: hypothetical protein QGH83_00935 [Candidatus Pacebacteria bacterium]|jgi:hypothetical protein|nr:hypothetical protein [Candidatus Paceibacterota bacterium]|tara:strand:+ start:1339 stop:1923 length:585 start_codon:yes stop_codon:yes gene_type:complete